MRWPKYWSFSFSIIPSKEIPGLISFRMDWLDLWHHWLDGRESEWTPGVGDGQGGLVCCDSWGHKESDTTERLNWTDWTSPFYSGIIKMWHCIAFYDIESDFLWGFYASSCLCRMFHILDLSKFLFIIRSRLILFWWKYYIDDVYLIKKVTSGTLHYKYIFSIYKPVWSWFLTTFRFGFKLPLIDATAWINFNLVNCRKIPL